MKKEVKHLIIAAVILGVAAVTALVLLSWFYTDTSVNRGIEWLVITFVFFLSVVVLIMIVRVILWSLCTVTFYHPQNSMCAKTDDIELNLKKGLRNFGFKCLEEKADTEIWVTDNGPIRNVFWVKQHSEHITLIRIQEIVQRVKHNRKKTDTLVIFTDPAHVKKYMQFTTYSSKGFLHVVVFDRLKKMAHFSTNLHSFSLSGRKLIKHVCSSVIYFE